MSIALALAAGCSGGADTADDAAPDPFASLTVPGEYANRQVRDFLVVTEESLKLELQQVNPRTRKVGERFSVNAYITLDYRYWDIEVDRLVSGALAIDRPGSHPASFSLSSHPNYSTRGVPQDVTFIAVCKTVGIGAYTVRATAQVNDADGNASFAPTVVTADGTVDCVSDADPTATAPSGSANVDSTGGSIGNDSDATSTRSGGDATSSQVVDGMLVEATVTQWNGDPQPSLRRTWSTFVDILRYTLHFTVKDGPEVTAGRRDVEYQVFQGDSIFPFYDDGGSTVPRTRSI
ncbi:MAG: hypothetical protein O3B65_00490 [Chloroflexi bacterium]|nr:hypothetical protein [Chloroflexota bacterium]